MPGRKRRISRYISGALRRVKNISTRRTKVAVIQRDLHRASQTKSNRRINPKGH